jgi:carboxypeptidase Q
MRKLLAVAVAVCSFAGAQETIDQDANWKFRREETGHSQIMRTLHMLTDRYGPRLTGTDKAGEIVMLGGHLDSWHSATGATGNAIGCSMMMEAVRLIQTPGLKPRRTIRIALWSGEEQGLLGPQAYVKEHFGTFEEPKAEYARLVAYFNIDSGTGRIRGASVFGPPEAAAVVRGALAPFEDLGVVGAAASKTRNAGGTDSTSFNNAGLAGVGLNQDPIEYGTHTWHTNLDTYERIVPEDAAKSAIVIAGAVWYVVNREAMLPRFAKDQMPPPPKPEAAKPEAAKPAAATSGMK